MRNYQTNPKCGNKANRQENRFAQIPRLRQPPLGMTLKKYGKKDQTKPNRRGNPSTLKIGAFGSPGESLRADPSATAASARDDIKKVREKRPNEAKSSRKSELFENQRVADTNSTIRSDTTDGVSTRYAAKLGRAAPTITVMPPFGASIRNASSSVVSSPI
jgi:hypothetical protein